MTKFTLVSDQVAGDEYAAVLAAEYGDRESERFLAEVKAEARKLLVAHHARKLANMWLGGRVPVGTQFERECDDYFRSHFEHTWNADTEGK